jgi:transposase
LSDSQRVTLATIGKKLGTKALGDIASIVTPETILRWHRQLVAEKFNTSVRRKAKAVGRPTTNAATVEQILTFARENPTWGYRRITGALAALEISLSHQTVKNILEDHGIDPAPSRKSKTSWTDFIRSHTDCLLATDFLTTEVWTTFGLVTYYVLFFIHVGSRKVYLGGITANPNDAWMRQAARNLTSGSCDILSRCRYLLRDRDTKFTVGFDMILRAAGIEPTPLPARSPNLNAFAERFVRSIKEECLDRMIFFGEASLRYAVTEYIAHHQHERPHQGKENRILFPLHPSDPQPRDGPIVCRERLGGLLRFYHRKEAA